MHTCRERFAAVRHLVPVPSATTVHALQELWVVITKPVRTAQTVNSL